MGFVAVVVVAALAAFLLTGAVRRYAVKAKLLDIPNARSSHDVPTPRGGGLAIVVAVLAALPVLWWWGALSGPMLAALWPSAAAVALVGWIDDNTDVRVAWRLAVHLLAGTWVVWNAGGLPPLPLPGTALALGAAGGIIAVLFIGWMINLYNFMDGIDGIAGVEAVTVAAMASLLVWQGGNGGLALVPAVLAAASLGFLIWNWPPAKIFMGDAGSGFLGFALAALAVLTWAEAGLTFWAWLILLGAFIVDASVTLARRMLRGERFYEAHRSHAYQHAARHFGSHRPVTVAAGGINLFWLAPLAWVAAAWPQWGVVLMLTAWAPILLICLYFRAGLRE